MPIGKVKSGRSGGGEGTEDGDENCEEDGGETYGYIDQI
jgi:hypothetical protein